jgi:hypothetical protein
MSDAPVRINKIKISPYPISAVVTGNLGSQAMIRGSIVKLTLTGMLIEVAYAFVTNEKCEVQFTLPVVGIDFKEPMVVIKTYDMIKSKTEEKTEIKRLFEFHFRNLKLGPKEDIENFLRQIGQLK